MFEDKVIAKACTEYSTAWRTFVVSAAQHQMCATLRYGEFMSASEGLTSELGQATNAPLLSSQSQLSTWTCLRDWFPWRGTSGKKSILLLKTESVSCWACSLLKLWRPRQPASDVPSVLPAFPFESMGEGCVATCLWCSLSSLARHLQTPHRWRGFCKRYCQDREGLLSILWLYICGVYIV